MRGILDVPLTAVGSALLGAAAYSTDGWLAAGSVAVGLFAGWFVFKVVLRGTNWRKW